MHIDTYSVFEFLLELNQMSARELIATYKHDSQKLTPLIFPIEPADKSRISEQELRFTMACILAQKSFSDITFSLETPTNNTYSFARANARRASTDMTIFFEDNIKLNIEFKSKNPSKAPMLKDIQKLVSENNYKVHYTRLASGWVLRILVKSLPIVFIQPK